MCVCVCVCGVLFGVLGYFSNICLNMLTKRSFSLCLFGDGCFSKSFDVSCDGHLLLLRSHGCFPVKFVVDLNVSRHRLFENIQVFVLRERH